MNDEILLNLIKSINSFSIQFRDNVYNYLYESDVQSALFAKLREEINRDVDVDGIDNTKKYKLNLIHTEYLQSIDICCLDFDAISPIKESKIYKSNNGHDDFIYQLPVLLAIELKFEKGERGTKAFLGTLKDKEKIINSDKKHIIKKWICICFIQSEEVLKKHATNHYCPVKNRIDSIGY